MHRTLVILAVGLAPPTVTVPDLVGQPQADAQTELLAAQLLVGTLDTARRVAQRNVPRSSPLPTPPWVVCRSFTSSLRSSSHEEKRSDGLPASARRSSGCKASSMSSSKPSGR